MILKCVILNGFFFFHHARVLLKKNQINRGIQAQKRTLFLVYIYNTKTQSEINTHTYATQRERANKILYSAIDIQTDGILFGFALPFCLDICLRNRTQNLYTTQGKG